MKAKWRIRSPNFSAVIEMSLGSGRSPDQLPLIGVPIPKNQKYNSIPKENRRMATRTGRVGVPS